MIVYPAATIPLPSVDFQGAPRFATLVSPPGRASLSRRSRFHTSYVNLSVQWVLDEAQKDLLDTFIETTLSNGTAQFMVELRYPEETSLTEWIVRLSGRIVVTSLEGHWGIRSMLDLVRLNALDAAAYVATYEAFNVSGESGEDPYVPFETSDGDDFNVTV